MPTAYKILGQAAPAANTFVDLYKAPVGANAVISTVNICNTGFASNSYFRLLARQSGNTISAQQYLAYDIFLSPSDSIALSLGMSMAPDDVLTGHGLVGNVSFTVFGTEISA